MPLIELGCSCTPDCPPIGASQGPPGPTGGPGPTGAIGPPGINNFSALTAPFTVPSAGDNANAQLENTSWMGEGESVYLAGAGYFTVVQLNSTSVAVLNNPGYPGNVAPLTVIGVGANCGGAGPQGPPGQNFVLTSPLGISLGGTGQGTKQAGFNALSPLAEQGQIIGFDGVNNVAVVGPALNGQILLADSTTAPGVRWGNQSELVIDFNTFSPAQNKGDLITDNGSVNVALPVGANGYILSANSTQATGLQWVPAEFNAFVRVVVGTGLKVLAGTEDVVGITHSGTPGPTQIVLGPTGAYLNQFVMIKDEYGDADVNNVTITTSDGTTIEGNQAYVINQPFGHVWMYSDGTQFQVL